jgi:hypothetical protein
MSETSNGKGSKAATAEAVEKTQRRKRQRQRSFPAATFEEALELPLAIQRIGGGEKVRRLTLFEQLDKSPESSASRMMITNSNRYGLTSGSYKSEWLELTPEGKVASSSDSAPREQLRARFGLAIQGVDPFRVIYEKFKDHRLPSHAALRDALHDAGYPEEETQECVETFIVNAKFLGLLRTVAGSERMISVEQLLDDLPRTPISAARPVTVADEANPLLPDVDGDWSKLCFYIAPIGAEDSEQRRHSDLILASLVEPAIAELHLTPVRADAIDKPGIITTQVIEHILKARLVIVDLSFHNPNVFYELALRHATGKPTIHLVRTEDSIPFDIGEFRTIKIDTSDLYAFVPQMETWKAEIATHARRALDEEGTPSGPLDVYYPDFRAALNGGD